MMEVKKKKKLCRRRRKTEWGTVWYLPKKKCGRKKKRGPKKKVVPKQRVYKKKPPFIYQIAIFTGKTFKKRIGKFRELSEAFEMKAELLKQNKEVIFPKEVENYFNRNEKVSDFQGEYLLLKKNTTGEEQETQFRNEYGKLVNNKVSNGEWIIIDKFPMVIEETFWVYGYNSRSQKDRKTITWIAENLAQAMIDKGPNLYVNIYLYNNKVIFRYDDADFNFVICKNVSDAIRMYNFLQEYFKKEKRVFFTGGISGTSQTKRSHETIKMIMEKTGWSLKDVSRCSTRH